MGTIRAGWRLLLVVAITAFVVPFLILGKVLELPAQRASVRLKNFCFRNWSRSVLWVLNARLEVHGVAPETPFFLVANHLSYVDILVLASQADAVFIAKSEVSSWPIVGWLCRAVNTIFVDRTMRRDLPRVIAEIEQVLDDGRGVVLFPEGTSTAGYEVGRFRPSLLEVAVRAALPVSYAALSYRTRSGSAPAHLAVSWWGGMEFPGHCWQLLGLRGFAARLDFGTETVRESDRKRLAERLQAEVAGRFVPVAKLGAAGKPA